MKMIRLAALTLTLSLLFSACAAAELLDSLPMNDYSRGPELKLEHYRFAESKNDFCAEQMINGQKYKSAMSYEDESITVTLYSGRFADSTYTCAHVKIMHPSQLRTASAALSDTKGKYQPKGNFSRTNLKYRGRHVADAVNAVVSINGDFYTKPDKCKVVLRQGIQVRNNIETKNDLLIIDYNGDFSILANATKASYADYYKANKDSMYQVFCFGPVLVQNGASVIDKDFVDRNVGSWRNNQRAAIAQIGPLEYLLITCDGSQSKGSKGMTIYQFAQLCEQEGRKINPESGCRIAYNLDGGNSATINFIGVGTKTKRVAHVKVNCPEIERMLGDIIYFATLEK